MDTSVAVSVDDIRGGGGDAMMVTTDEDDLFLGMDEESRELCFSWAEDCESTNIIVGDGDCAVLPSPPSMNGDTTTKTQENLSRGREGSMEQISRPKNTKPQTKVYNFNDLFSSSRPTAALRHPSNNYRGRVRMDTDMEPPHQGDPEVIQAVPEAQAPERKKRIRWTNDEHKLFLIGYKKFNKKWTKISKNYIPWKTPSQLASHAQKYFQRQRIPVENWITDTVNNFSADNLTPEDYSRLAPHQQPPPATDSRPRSDGGPTLAQQSLRATLEERNTSRSSSMQRPALVQQSFGVPRQGANTPGFSPTWNQTDAGVHSSSHRQPLPHLGAMQRNQPSRTFYPGVDAWMRMTQPVLTSSEYYHQPPSMLWNNNINIEPLEGLHDLFTVPSDYRADYGLNRYVLRIVMK